MICPNCGGEYADWALKCPYCDSVNDKGSELVYMKHMEELRQRLDQVDEEAEEDYEQEVSTGTKKNVKIIIGIGVAILVFLAIFMVVNVRQEKAYEKQEVRQHAWEQEEFVKLDDMYAQGDYDGLLEEYYAVLDEDEYDIYDWTHYYFIVEFYQNYQNIEYARTMFPENDDVTSGTDLGLGIYSAMYLLYEEDDAVIQRYRTYYDKYGTGGLTEEEETLIRGYQQEASALLTEDLGWSDQELEDFKSQCFKDGYVIMSTCFDKGDEIAETLGWE